MTATTFAGLTWDHPRGYNALAAAAARLDPARDGVAISWDRQPLEGFESHPIADLCARYDLVVLDHPHVGEAVEADCLRPLEEVFGNAVIADLEAQTIGPCLSSYAYGGLHWALPLDAATQVMARRRDLVAHAPVTWEDVAALSRASGTVALSLAGPHAALTFLSIAAAMGEPPAERDPAELVSAPTGRRVLDLMSELAARSPASVADANPIAILAHMAANDDVALCPLIYGYVNYAAPASGRPVAFSDAPRMASDGRPGSTLGGTGIGISRRCAVTDELRAHLLWLMGAEAQQGFIPDHEGQPSRRSAWHDVTVNARWGNFYRDTAQTLEAAYVRPRHSGYIAFQARASALLREAFAQGRNPDTTLEALQALYAASRAPGAER